MDTLRIAMWSGPRNISTAMMRAFENRPDCAVIDEPFYAAYLAATGLEHPAREAVLRSQPTDWRAVASSLSQADPAPVYYQKHMTQHLLPEMDLAFTECLLNCFLIREPRRIIASYARVRPQFTLQELGLPQQRALFERECQRLGAAPPVIDAGRVLADPRGTLSRLCARIGIEFSERMLHWPAGPRDSDGVWAPHWYAAVWRSTGFVAARPGEEEKATGDSLTAAQEAMCVHAEGFYRDMLIHAVETLTP
jgi:hypothetical protein